MLIKPKVFIIILRDQYWKFFKVLSFLLLPKILVKTVKGELLLFDHLTKIYNINQLIVQNYVDLII